MKILISVVVFAILVPFFSVRTYANGPEQVRTQLEQVQHQVGDQSQILSAGIALIEQGITSAGQDAELKASWLRVKWYYLLLVEDHAQGIQVLEEALNLTSNAAINVDEEIGIRDDLSYSHVILGHISEAKALLRESIVLALESDSELLPYLYYGIGDAYRKTGELNVARSYFESAKQKFEQQADEFGRQIALLKLGSLERDEGNVSAAIQAHLQAFDYFQDQPDQNYRELVIEIELARDYIVSGELSLALDRASSAWNDTRALQEQKIDAGLLLLEINSLMDGRGSISRNMPKSKALVDQMGQLLDVSIDSDVISVARPIRKLKYYELAISYYLGTGELAKMERMGELGLELTRKISRSLRGSDENFFAWMSRAHSLVAIYVEALYKTKPDQIPQVLDSQYDWRNRVDIVRASSVVSDAIEEAEANRLREFLDAELALVEYSARNKDSSVVGDLAFDVEKSRLETLRDQARDFYLSVRRSNAPVQAAHSEWSLDMPSIPESDVVLRYYVQENVSFVVAMSHENTEFFDLRSRSDVREMVKTSTKSIRERGRGGQRSVELAALMELLPENFLRSLPNVSRLVIIPDDVVHLVPFSALNTADNPEMTYQPLGVQYEITRTHSVSGYYAKPAAQHSTNSEDRLDLAIFANPVFSKSPQNDKGVLKSWANQQDPLPYTELEANQIVRTFPDRRIATFLGTEATSGALKSPQVTSAKLLHIATHGYFNHSTPGIVGLLTARKTDDGRSLGHLFTLNEILSQRYSSNLVIISGCETMRGREINGLGVKSLAQVFLSRGAGVAIGTLWKVPDQGTATFMKYFHEYLQTNGGNASLALKQTKRQMSKSRRYSDPVYWAGFAMDSTRRTIEQKVL